MKAVLWFVVVICGGIAAIASLFVLQSFGLFLFSLVVLLCCLLFAFSKYGQSILFPRMNLWGW